MWNVLNGSYDEFMPLYKDGANDIYFTGQETIPSEKEDIYLSEETENWNEGIDREKTRNSVMHSIIYTATPHSQSLTFCGYVISV